MTGKKFFLLFFLCFTLPLLTAKLALEFSWFTSGVNNQGDWLEGEIHILPASHRHWQLVYVQQGECGANCELALYTLQQIYLGFGRQQEQLNLLVLAGQLPPQLGDFSALHWQSQSGDVSLNELQNHIVIVNQQGMALLRYPIISDQKQMLEVGRRIRTDLRRLMTYDRGGY